MLNLTQIGDEMPAKYTSVKIQDEWLLKQRLAADKITQGEFFKICQNSYTSDTSETRKVWNYLIKTYGLQANIE